MSVKQEESAPPSSFGSRKRKRSPEDEANDKVDFKRRKFEERREDLKALADLETFSDEFEDSIIYDINNVLVQHEKIFLQKDPFGSNFLAATWSNDGTLLRKDAPTLKWTPRHSHLESDIFPEEVFAEILTNCDPSTLAALMRVSMSVNKMLHDNQLIWRKLFYRRHWRLKHDIENNFVGIDPDLADRSSWVNVVPDNQVDWFGEYKRNHVNAKIIKNTIEEIKSKLQLFVNAFAEVKEGVTNPLFFEPGVTDKEIDDRIVMDGIPITNDLRELLKCCNGARFYFNEELGYIHEHGIKILFPSLETLSVGPYTMKHFLRASNYWGLDDESYEEYLETDDIPQELRTSTPATKLAFNESKMQSDSDEYVMGDDTTSDNESKEDEDNMSTKNQSTDAKKQTLNDKLILFNITDEKFNHGVYSPQQVYCPQTGSIDHYNYDFFEDGPSDSFSSIIVYLQDLSDYLDLGHSIAWLKFDDYVVGNWDDEYQLIGMNEPWNIGPGQTKTTEMWFLLVAGILLDFSDALAILPRASKLLYAAAQDFIIKVFTKAWSLETTDTLQPDTLIEAANQVTCTFERDYERVTSDEELDDCDNVDI